MEFTELKKLEKATEEVNGEINKLGVEFETLEGIRSKVAAELDQLKKDTEDMVTGSAKMSATGYLKNKAKILNLEGELKAIEMDLSHYETAFEVTKEDLNTNILNTYLKSGAITAEFNGNALEKQKELFKKFVECEEIIKEIEGLEDQYRDVVKGVDHIKTQYYTFRTNPFINDVHSRFGIRGKIEYSTAHTTNKYPFEL